MIRFCDLLGLGARRALLTVLAHFFEQGRWGLLATTIVEEAKLTLEDQVFVLMQPRAISTAREQKSIFLQKRAEAAYSEFLCQKTKASGARGRN